MNNETTSVKYRTCWRIVFDEAGGKSWLGPSNMLQTRNYPGMVAVKDKVTSASLHNIDILVEVKLNFTKINRMKVLGVFLARNILNFKKSVLNEK
jgi:hypothetical protein